MTSNRSIQRMIASMLIVMGSYFFVRFRGDIRAVFAYMFIRSSSGMMVPLDHCTVEDYRAGSESELGALSIPSCSVKYPFMVGPMLKFPIKLDPHDKNLRQGEIWVDLYGLGLGKWVNLAGGRVQFVVVVPNSMSTYDERARRAGGSVILESEDFQGHSYKSFGPWVDFSKMAGPEVLEFTVHPDKQGGYRDPGFVGTEGRIRKLGLKIALNSQEMGLHAGMGILVSVRVFLPDPETNRHALERARELRRPPRDYQTLAALGVVPSDTGHPLVGRFLPKRNIRSVGVVPEPGRPGRTIQSAEVYFPTYEPSVEGRSARLVYEFRGPFNGFSRALSVRIAVGPALLGYQPRPHLVQFELEDRSGKIIRGPSTDLSSGMTLDSNHRMERSLWLPVEIRHEYLTDPDDFNWEKIEHIRIRFLTGKGSDEFHGPYPFRGTMLLSGITVRELRPGPVRVQTYKPNPPVDRSPVPPDRFQVGVNYDWIPQFGYSVGVFGFSGRTRCGMSEPLNTFRLHRDFARLARHNIRLVRLWIWADLRSGAVITDRPGSGTSGVIPDRCYLADLTTMLDALEAHGLSGIFSLFDFKIADGVEPRKTYGSRIWAEGEFPELVTRRRDELVEFARPFIQLLSSRAKKNPSLTYAVELMNEPSYAAAVMRPDKIHEFRAFLRQLRDMIWSVDPQLPVTLGARNRREMIQLWKDLDESGKRWIFQYHFYDAIAEEEGLPLRFPVGQLGIRGPVIVGEVEPTDVEKKIVDIYESGAEAAVFWGMNELDSYVIPLDRLRDALSSLRKRGTSR